MTLRPSEQAIGLAMVFMGSRYRSLNSVMFVGVVSGLLEIDPVDVLQQHEAGCEKFHFYNFPHHFTVKLLADQSFLARAKLLRGFSLMAKSK